jgi:TolB protein
MWKDFPRMMMRAASISACCAGVMAAPLGGQTPPAGTPAVKPEDYAPVFLDANRLKFQTNRHGGAEDDYVINVDGTGEHPAPPAAKGLPSPDGKWTLLDERDEKGDRHSLVLASKNGSVRHALAPELPLTGGGQWSPDGRQILFIGVTPSGSARPEIAIYVANADGSHPRRLLAEDPHPYQIGPSYSPDGRHVAYAMAEDTTARPPMRIMVANADGSNPRPLSPFGKGTEWPRWSPDGKQVAYFSGRSGNAEIYVVNADGTNERRLTDSPARDETPAWSPDGKRIAFQSDRDGAMTLYIMNADGTGVRRIRH